MFLAGYFETEIIAKRQPTNLKTDKRLNLNQHPRRGRAEEGRGPPPILAAGKPAREYLVLSKDESGQNNGEGVGVEIPPEVRGNGAEALISCHFMAQ